MERKIILTSDGSHTLFVPELEEHFHSVHGAIQESMHVFITNGLLNTSKPDICIFEVGFGTGLNALLTLANKGAKSVRYFSIEKYPLLPSEFEQLNFAKLLSGELQGQFQLMHQCEWNSPHIITPGFELTKLEADLTNFSFQDFPDFDLIYFDAFAPNKQGDMWAEDIFRNLSDHTNPRGIFVTYCAQGEVRRKLIRSGFEMQRIPGPPGKKQMLYGEKA
ncbi:tRNA (5-methylaminomethyl-2-thiouridine)(34)-methyltransferase MnmD [Mangrovibacterium lignilyticum]|uniref:tRNA (5-methylaminomethyl-2-thiouridine)(34)-methyltransferase MnmD n=1 Tax=Mangrovibacterium lignilyticum TaxID=2668052 RepID=UPI0019687664|nr:tRNA (5-methylaminomethyl-2-thiouridine)(34)-methyltransferase MnmD [Mangrovibacterium lignilyticum]